LFKFLTNFYIVYINNNNNDGNSEDVSETTSSDDDCTPNHTQEENTPTEETYQTEEDITNALNKIEKSLNGDDSGLGDLGEEFPSFFIDASSKEEALNNIKDSLEAELLDLKFGKVNLNEVNEALSGPAPPDTPESGSSSSAEPPSPSIKRKRSYSDENEEFSSEELPSKNAKIDDDYSTSSIVETADMKSLGDLDSYVDYILAYLGPVSFKVSVIVMFILLVRLGNKFIHIYKKFRYLI
jgi:hypothetical protein